MDGLRKSRPVLVQGYESVVMVGHTPDDIANGVCVALCVARMHLWPIHNCSTGACYVSSSRIRPFDVLPILLSHDLRVLVHQPRKLST